MKPLVSLNVRSSSSTVTVRKYSTAKVHEDRGVFKKVLLPRNSFDDSTHVRNGVVSGPADFGWGGPLRARRRQLGAPSAARTIVAWQGNDELGEFAEISFDVDPAAMLLDDDVVGH